MTEKELNEFGWAYYATLLVASGIIVLAFAGFCGAVYSGDWRWLFLCSGLLLFWGS
jgi:hypothetical protein